MDDVRSALDAALCDLHLTSSAYTDSSLATGASGTEIKKAHLTDLRTRATSNSGISGSGNPTGNNVKYVLQDAQGSTRAIMNNNSTASTILARHDYLPLGEEVASGVGLRTVAQGYGDWRDCNRWSHQS